MGSNQIDKNFAKAWDLSRGDFSKDLAEKILEYAHNNKIKLKKALDICCGCSNLLNVFNSNNLKCFGTETRTEMLEYSKEKYPGVTYCLTKNMFDIPIKSKVDIITCNQDIVNYFENFEDWKAFFKNVNKHLSSKGMFVFDFYTKFKLQNWNETTYSSSQWLDCITNVKSGLYNKSIITYTYFVLTDNYMTKTRDIVVESYFETQNILDELKKAGFKRVLIVDQNLNQIQQNDYIERMHILAFKK